MLQKRPLDVLVFATDLRSSYDVKAISKQMDHLSWILKWTVDLMDWEHVLRVETSHPGAASVIKKKIRKMGYRCNELNH